MTHEPLNAITSNHLLDTGCKQLRLIIMMMMQTVINTTVMKMMIWAITLIGDSAKPISSHYYSRGIRQSVHRNISQSIGFMNHY